MKKILGSALLSLAFYGSSQAAFVSKEKANTVANHFYGSIAQGSNLQLVKTFNAFGKVPTVYVFQSANANGFVLVAADDKAQPILGYSTESKFLIPGAAASPEATYWISDYSKQIASLKLNPNYSIPSEVSAAWQKWSTNSIMAGPSVLTTPVAPMLTTLWNQNPYYNQLCPTNTPAGCVATAMAQIMKFWNNPTVGTGNHSYTASGFGVLSANFGTTTYDWANMPNNVTASSTATQKTAVATLMYHCGVAVDMNYNPSGSGSQVISQGSSMPSAENALKNYFGYKSSIRGQKRIDYTDSTWHKMLMFEIDNARPILYAGFGAVGGHAFVFDGYDATEMFHINWGWGGLSNGYFVVNSLNPSALGTGGGGGNFNSGQQALVMIEPNGSTLPPNPFDPDNLNGGINLVEALAPSPMLATVEPGNPYSNNADVKNIGTISANDFVMLSLALDTNDVNFDNPIILKNETFTLAPGSTMSFTTNIQSVSMAEGVYYILRLYNNNGNTFYFITDSVTDEPSLPLLIVKNPTGVKENAALANTIKIYPNPASNTLQLDASQFNGKMERFVISSILGQELKSGLITNSTEEINVSTLPVGNYILQINSDKGSFSKNFVIER